MLLNRHRQLSFYEAVALSAPNLFTATRTPAEEAAIENLPQVRYSRAYYCTHRIEVEK